MKTFQIADALPFVDIEDPRTHRALDRELAGDLAGFGVPKLNISVVRDDKDRRVSRAIATWAYPSKPARSWICRR